MASWMIYTAMIGALVWIGALCFERIAAARRWPRRSVWSGALTVAIGWSVLNAMRNAMRGHEPHSAAPVAQAFTIIVGPTASTPTISTATAPGIELDQRLTLAWAVLSALCVLRLALGTVALRHRRRTWRGGHVDGVDVQIAAHDGPAVVGIRLMQVVVPEWILTLDEPLRALILCHEEEHRRARDPRLIFATAIAVALMPWNLALWLMSRRLRLAIEMDCDARVLRVHPSPERYGLLMLAVAQRRAPHPMLAPTFLQPTTHLERRIAAMQSSPPGGRRTILTAAGLAVATFTVACSLRTAPAPIVHRPANDHAALDAFMTAQGFGNWSYVRAAAGNRAPSYPDASRQAAAEGAVLAEFVVDTTGRVDHGTPIKIITSTNDLFAAAVREALPSMRFVPAEVDGHRVKQLAQVPFAFRLAGSDAGPAEDSTHRTVACGQGTCPVLRLQSVIVIAALR